jgi:hypothetical protein
MFRHTHLIALDLVWPLSCCIFDRLAQELPVSLSWLASTDLKSGPEDRLTSQAFRAFPQFPQASSGTLLQIKHPRFCVRLCSLKLVESHVGGMCGVTPWNRIQGMSCSNLWLGHSGIATEVCRGFPQLLQLNADVVLCVTTYFLPLLTNF